MSGWTYEDLVRVTETFAGGDEIEPQKARKRARILEAATQLFIQHGYRKTSVDDVARRAGVAKGTVYLYFPRKADLLGHALLEERKSLLGRFEPLFADELRGAERLRLWLVTLLDSLRDQPLSARLITGDRELGIVLDELDHDLIQQTVDLKVSFLAPLVAEARGRDDVDDGDRETALLLMATFQSAGFFQDETQHFGIDQDQFHHKVVDLLLHGVVGTDRSASISGRPTAVAAKSGESP